MLVSEQLENRGRSRLLRFEISGAIIYVRITNYNEIKIGGPMQLNTSHMSTLYTYNGFEGWYTILKDFATDSFVMHVKIIDDEIWCNVKEDLPESDSEFPFLFISKLRLRAIKKQLQELYFEGEWKNE